ncbi:hypothetical protein [Halomarina oriensis]|uniref:DUF8159 domain-containing protein n=1 Tax=Halomarina oriensis TaxID=671145 RepID=A0A6B0GMT9_9EURY|nr:hypothetical protein [Halomarina oriensis]MWG34799.1 hypothetical protein [Halomarina oriensis]
MNRRRYLGLAGTLATTVLAGCSADEGPSDSANSQPTSATTTEALATVAEPSTPASTPVVETPESIDLEDEDYLAFYESYLIGEGVDVTDTRMQESVVGVAYRTAQTTQDGLAAEMGVVGGAYAGLVGEGWETEGLFAQILDANSQRIGDFTVSAQSAQQFINGEISQDEYSLRILQSLEIEE